MGKVFWVGNCLGRLKGHLDRVPGTWLIWQFVGTLKGLCKVGGHAHNHEHQQLAGTESQELVISREEGREHGLPREHCRECLQWRSVAKTIMGLGNTSDRRGWSQATVWCSLEPQVFFYFWPSSVPAILRTHTHAHTYTYPTSNSFLVVFTLPRLIPAHLDPARACRVFLVLYIFFFLPAVGGNLGNGNPSKPFAPASRALWSLAL